MKLIYILQSQQDQTKFYVGLTKDLKNRLQQHNQSSTGHTAKYQPWKIKTFFCFTDSNKAEKFERYLKSSVGRRFQKRHF